MRKLFWGLLLFVYFNLKLNGFVVNLLPEFAGTLLMLSGIRELNGESPSLDAARTVLIAATVEFALVWLRNLFDVYIPFVDAILYWAMIIFKVYIPYQAVIGVKELEQCREIDLHGGPLSTSCKIYCVALPVGAVLSVLANVTPGLAYLALLCSIAAIVAYIVYLVYFYKTGTAYAQSAPAVIERMEETSNEP